MQQVDLDSKFNIVEFEEIKYSEEDHLKYANTTVGRFTVLSRMTGFGYRDIESGYRDNEGLFWLASGYVDIVYDCSDKTVAEAIDYIKGLANICVGVK